MFAPNSRYRNLDVATLASPEGGEIRYVRRRFLPIGPPAAILAVHAVTGSDRIDNVTAAYLGDPELFWEVCDANAATRPDKLTADPGRTLIIPTPGVGSV